MTVSWEWGVCALAMVAAVAPVVGSGSAAPPARIVVPPTYLALGDSYTICEGVLEKERWPVQLAARLRRDGSDLADPEIIARTGWTTDELDLAITAKGPTAAYALVTLLIGVNNQFRGRSVDEYRAQFRGLLARAVVLARGEPARVIVVSIPDWGVTPFNSTRDAAQIAREIDAFNGAARDEAARAGAHWVDITDLTRATPHEVVADGLHPHAAMYAKWVSRIEPVARTILAH